MENKKPQAPAQKKVPVQPKPSAQPSPVKPQAPTQKGVPQPQPKTAKEYQEQLKAAKQKAAKQQAASGAPTQSTIATIATKSFAVQAWQVALAIAVVLAIVTGAVFLGTVLGDKDEDDPIVDYTGDLNNGGSADPSGITLPGYPALTFPANSKKVALELPNPGGNPCYFRYTLTIVETGEEIYESELLEPGKMLETLTLNNSLARGTYTLRIEIDTFSLADGTTPMNGGVQEVKLTVK